MIIYIHGFASSGQANKASAFRQYFKSIKQPFIAPSLPYQPELAIKTLEELIESYSEEIYLIGSSLGGYYSLYLSQLDKVKKITIINPAMTPATTLQQAIGKTNNYFDNSYFSWNLEHALSLNNYPLTNLTLSKIKLLLQEGDEVLDYKQAALKLEGCTMKIEKNGNHSFQNIEHHFESIFDFFKTTLNEEIQDN